MLHLSEFVWTLRSSVLVVFYNLLLIDATADRSKISSDQKRFFIALSLYPLSFLANTPFNKVFNTQRSKELQELGFIFKTGLSLKCRDAFAFEFTFITHFYFCVALVMYFLEVQKTCFLVVIGKLIIDVSVRALDPCEKKIVCLLLFCFYVKFLLGEFIENIEVNLYQALFFQFEIREERCLN